LSGLIYRVASIVQCVFPGKIHSGELFIPVMNGYGSFGMLDQRVIALPKPMRLLMQLHFNLDAFVDGLNHESYVPSCVEPLAKSER